MRVDRAFAFVDLCGFTAYTDVHGDDEVVLVLAELRTALREASARRGVRVVKWLGDGAMLSSTMTDALVALVIELDHRMTAAIPSLALKAGLDCGPVIMFEGDDYIGRCVNIAARLCDQAQAHELLATETVLAGRPPWTAEVRCEPRVIRGIGHPVAVGALRVDDGSGARVLDPVCSLEIPVAHAVNGRFCSTACEDAWLDASRHTGLSRPGGQPGRAI